VCGFVGGGEGCLLSLQLFFFSNVFFLRTLKLIIIVGNVTNMVRTYSG